MLETVADIRRCLETSRDWYQPASTSVLQLGTSRVKGDRDEVFGPGFLGGLDERTVLWRRLRCLEPVDRELLLLWHVAGLPPGEVARRIGMSRRHCFRRRDAALRALARMGAPSGNAVAP
jgi:DNA-directed RNA polymerase specialized sigma24 family protein